MRSMCDHFVNLLFCLFPHPPSPKREGGNSLVLCCFAPPTWGRGRGEALNKIKIQHVENHLKVLIFGNGFRYVQNN
jgi:hypothetical protein